MVPITFTLCFLTRGEQVLMLHRAKPPNQGLWNGVGGHIEPGETPLECILREVEEETDFRLETARYRGILTWEGFEIESGGLHIFTAEVPPELREDHPESRWGEPRGPSFVGVLRDNGEGRLEWKPREWVFSSPEVVSNIPCFAPLALGEAPVQHYHFRYRDGQMLGWEINSL